MSEFVLEATAVDKAYGSKLVLDELSFRIRKGEFCSVVGPSGCGKSTLLRLILGQEKPTRGRIAIDGTPVGNPDPSRGIVYQRYSLFPHLSVLENVVLGRKLCSSFLAWHRIRAEVEHEAVSILARMRLESDLHKYPHQLSGGMQQRVAIAQALMMKPKILLMDEPFGALDPGTKKDIHLFVLELWEDIEMNVFFVTHDLNEALFLGTRVFVLSQYYSDDRGDNPTVTRGAKLVCDLQVKKGASSTKVQHSQDFQQMLERIQQEGFAPEHLQHVKDFNLSHPDSMHSLQEGLAADSQMP